jgi:hypothetical protein
LQASETKLDPTTALPNLKLYFFTNAEKKTENRNNGTQRVNSNLWSTQATLEDFVKTKHLINNIEAQGVYV